MAMYTWWLVFVVTVRCTIFHFHYKHKVDINKTRGRSGRLFHTKSLIQCSIVCSIQDKRGFFYDKSAEWCSPDTEKQHCNYHTRMEDRRTHLAATCRFQKGLKLCNGDKNPPTTQSELTTKATHTDDLELVQCINLDQACEKGQLDVVKDILQRGLEDINCRGKWCRTPVMAAATNRHLRVFDYLVSQGCDLSAVDDHANNVLHVACKGGNTNIVRKLIVDNKCDIESKGTYSRRPIMWAVRFGHKDVYQLLSGNDCDLAAVDARKDNILHIACLYGQVDMVKYILSQTIFSKESRGFVGRTPVMTAAAGGHTDVLDFLVGEGCNLKTVDGANNNILHIACMNGRVEMVKYILSQNIVSIESRGLAGRTPVLHAAVHGEGEVVDFLVKQGCNLTAVDMHKDNILHLACYYGQVDTVKYILSQNIVSTESRGRLGRTPMMQAVWGGHIGIVDLLNSKNSSLAAVDDEGNTILHVACIESHVDMVRHLMSLGVVEGMKNVKNKSGRTPLQAAAKRGHIAVVRHLKGRK